MRKMLNVFVLVFAIAISFNMITPQIFAGDSIVGSDSCACSGKDDVPCNKLCSNDETNASPVARCMTPGSGTGYCEGDKKSTSCDNGCEPIIEDCITSS